MAKDSKFRIIIQNTMQGAGIYKTITLLDRGINRAKAFGAAMRKGFHSAPVRLLRNALAGLIGTLAAGVMQAAKFNIEMARAWTMTSEGVGWFREMRKEIIAMSAELGVATDQLSSGLYQELSRGVPKENLIDFLRTAAKVAVADGSTVEEIVLGMTNMLNGFGIEMSRSMEIADQMFNVVANGGLSFRELAAHISDVSGIAASAGIPFEQILAHIAAMTKQGDPASKATTSIRQSIVGLNKALGDGWAKQMTYQEALQKVWEKSGKSQTQLLKLVGSIEAVNAVLKGVDGNAAVAAQAREETANSAGRVDAAFQKVDMWRHWPKLWQSINGLVKTAGLELDERLAPAVDRIAEVLNGIRENDDLWAGLAKGLDEAIESVEDLYAYIQNAEGGAQEVAEAVGQILLGYSQKGSHEAVSILAKAVPLLGSALGKAAKDVFLNLNKDAPTREQASAAKKQAASETSSIGSYLDRLDFLLGQYREQNKQERLGREGVELQGKIGVDPGDTNIAQGKRRLQDALNSGAMENEAERIGQRFMEDDKRKKEAEDRQQRSVEEYAEGKGAMVQSLQNSPSAPAHAVDSAAPAQVPSAAVSDAQQQIAAELKKAADALAAAEKESKSVKARFGTPEEKAAAKAALEAAQAKAEAVRKLAEDLKTATGDQLAALVAAIQQLLGPEPAKAATDQKEAAADQKEAAADQKDAAATAAAQPGAAGSAAPASPFAPTDQERYDKGHGKGLFGDYSSPDFRSPWAPHPDDAPRTSPRGSDQGGGAVAGGMDKVSDAVDAVKSEVEAGSARLVSSLQYLANAHQNNHSEIISVLSALISQVNSNTSQIGSLASQVRNMRV